jgi:hypothetical protein
LQQKRARFAEAGVAVVLEADEDYMAQPLSPVLAPCAANKPALARKYRVIVSRSDLRNYVRGLKSTWPWALTGLPGQGEPWA